MIFKKSDKELIDIVLDAMKTARVRIDRKAGVVDVLMTEPVDLKSIKIIECLFEPASVEISCNVEADTASYNEVVSIRFFETPTPERSE